MRPAPKPRCHGPLSRNRQGRSGALLSYPCVCEGLWFVLLLVSSCSFVLWCPAVLVPVVVSDESPGLRLCDFLSFSSFVPFPFLCVSFPTDVMVEPRMLRRRRFRLPPFVLGSPQGLPTDGPRCAGVLLPLSLGLCNDRYAGHPAHWAGRPKVHCGRGQRRARAGTAAHGRRGGYWKGRQGRPGGGCRDGVGCGHAHDLDVRRRCWAAAALGSACRTVLCRSVGFVVYVCCYSRVCALCMV